MCDRQVVPRQRKHIVIIISDGERHDKIHELKSYTTESCQLGGCLDLLIIETYQAFVYNDKCQER